VVVISAEAYGLDLSEGGAVLVIKIKGGISVYSYNNPHYINSFSNSKDFLVTFLLTLDLSENWEWIKRVEDIYHP
jgi:hypothetical protein